MLTINNKLREVRKSKKLSQAELAKMIGSSQQRIAAYEKGANDIRNCTLALAVKMANALECSVEDLFCDEADDNSQIALSEQEQ